jgi:hypothetical protein
VEVVLRKTKEDMVKLIEPSKLMVFWVSTPVECWCTFLQVFFFNLTLVYDQTQSTGAVFSWLYGYLYCGRMMDFWRWQLYLHQGNLTSNALQPYSFPSSSKWSSEVVYFDV